MKYILIIGVFFTTFNAKADITANKQSQLKISGEMGCFKINPEITVPGNDSTTEAELKRLSERWMDAMLRHDSTLLDELMAPEYRLQKWDGTVVAKRALWFENLFHHIKITHFEQSDMLAQVYGDVAIVTSLYAWTGTFHDKAFDSKGYLTDVWVRNNNHWQVISRTNGAFEGSKTLYNK